LSECLLTNVTFVWLDTTVNAFVHCYIAAIAERLATNVTLVGFLAMGVFVCH